MVLSTDLKSVTQHFFDYNVVRGKTYCAGKCSPCSTVYIVNEEQKIISSSAENIGRIAIKSIANMKAFILDFLYIYLEFVYDLFIENK